MLTYFKLAWRNLWRNNRRTLITVTSVTFAVVLAMVMESMERGSWEHMIDNMARFHTGYIQVQDARFESEPSLDNAFYYEQDVFDDFIEKEDIAEFTVPRIETFMLAAGEQQTRGAMVMGILPENEHKLNRLKDRLSEGRFFESGDETAVVGRGLARRLNLTVGDTLVLLGQGRFGMTAAGKFAVSGLLDHPLPEMNNQVVYLALSDAQWLLSADEHLTALLVNPVQVRYSEELADRLQENPDMGIAENGELVVLTWREMMPEMLEAMEVDIAGTRMFMGILYIVIGFGLFGTVLTMTLERLREFGILLSVGMQRLRLAMVVQIETFLISLMGVTAGLGVGFLILLYFAANPIQITGEMAEVIQDMGFEPVLPFSMAPEVFYNQGLIIFIIAFVICLYPTFKIYRLNILDAARS
jgi:putative ABC transport system permease protein